MCTKSKIRVRYEYSVYRTTTQDLVLLVVVVVDCERGAFWKMSPSTHRYSINGATLLVCPQKTRKDTMLYSSSGASCIHRIWHSPLAVSSTYRYHFHNIYIYYIYV